VVFEAAEMEGPVADSGLAGFLRAVEKETWETRKEPARLLYGNRRGSRMGREWSALSEGTQYRSRVLGFLGPTFFVKGKNTEEGQAECRKGSNVDIY